MSAELRPWEFTDADMERLRAMTREAMALAQEAVAMTTATVEHSRAVLRAWHSVKAELAGEARTGKLLRAVRDAGLPSP